MRAHHHGRTLEPSKEPPASASRHETARASRMLLRLWVIRCPRRTGHRVAKQARPTNSLQPGLQAGRQVPEPTISFTSPNTHPETVTPEDPSQRHRSDYAHRHGTHYKGYKPESFWSTLKTEFYNRHSWPTKVEARLAVGRSIEERYNRRRRHSALAVMTPVQFEQHQQAATLAA